MPFLLRGASVDGMWCTDGGVVDRIGYEPWASWRGRKPTWIHLIERSMGAPSLPLGTAYSTGLFPSVWCETLVIGPFLGAGG